MIYFAKSTPDLIEAYHLNSKKLTFSASRVSKIVGSGNPWDALGNEGSVVCVVVCYWSRRQINARHIGEHKGNAKNNEICEPNVPGSDAVLHCLLLRNRCRICLRKFHIGQSDPRAIDRHRSHLSNTIWLLALDPQLVAGLLGYAPKLRTSPKCSEFCDLPKWECRFRFFITNESEHFIQFCVFDFIR